MVNQNYSVLMSVYFKEKRENLMMSIESILRQSVPPTQFVIVKDGLLTDELNEVINYYVKKYIDLFKIIELEKNVGLGRALNEGLEACDNELVARMDSDDISLETRCEKQLNMYADNKDLCILGTNIDEFYDKPSNIITSREVPSKHAKIVRFSKIRSPFNHPTVMYKKSEVLKLGGYSDLRRNQDYDLFVRMLNENCKAANIDESLLLFRADKDNLKRRKSWQRVRGDIVLRYKFWRKGYHSLLDFLFSCLGLLAIYISPKILFKQFSSKILRKKRK